MTPSNRFSMTMESLTELAPEIQAAQADPKSVLPTLSDVLAEFSPLPRAALFLGLAGDGLPVLLNLNDPIPGPILIVGDPGSGKTSLLQNIARAVAKVYQPEEVKYLILSNHLEEWKDVGSTNCHGAFSIHDPSAINVLASTSAWAHQNKGEHRFMLLLIDDLEALIKHLNSNQDLRWLLLRGPARHIWPIVTLNTKSAGNVYSWLNAFRTRLFGYMNNDSEASTISGLADASFKSLAKGSQFALREGNAWLQFWIPNLD